MSAADAFAVAHALVTLATLAVVTPALIAYALIHEVTK